LRTPKKDQNTAFMVAPKPAFLGSFT
jgi:hypothetical protein